jgi:hypothetical protein
MDGEGPRLQVLIKSGGDPKQIERSIAAEIQTARTWIYAAARSVISEYGLVGELKDYVTDGVVVVEMETALNEEVMKYITGRAKAPVKRPVNSPSQAARAKRDKRIQNAFEAFEACGDFARLAETLIRERAVNRVIDEEQAYRRRKNIRPAVYSEGNEESFEDALGRTLCEQFGEGPTPLSHMLVAEELAFFQRNIRSPALSPGHRVALAFRADDLFGAAGALGLCDPSTTADDAVERLRRYLINDLALDKENALRIADYFQANFDEIRHEALENDQVCASLFVIMNSHIARMLGVSDGWVSQLEQQAVTKLQEMWRLELLPQD